MHAHYFKHFSGVHFEGKYFIGTFLRRNSGSRGCSGFRVTGMIPLSPVPLGNPVSSRSFRFYRLFSNSLKWFAILASFPGTELLLMNAFTLYTDSKEIISNKPKSNCSGCCCIPLMSQRLNDHSLVLKQRKVWVTSP